MKTVKEPREFMLERRRLICEDVSARLKAKGYDLTADQVREVQFHALCGTSYELDYGEAANEAFDLLDKLHSSEVLFLDSAWLMGGTAAYEPDPDAPGGLRFVKEVLG